MSNRQSKYKRNHNGISIRPDYGKINISKRVIKLLEYPEFIHFEKYNDTYLALTVGSLSDENSYKVKVQNKGGHSINSVELVRKIFSEFAISRKEEDIFSPFYNIKGATINGDYAILVQMKNFNYRSY